MKRNVVRLLVAILVSPLLHACSQSRHDGMQQLCDSWSSCEACRTAPVASRATLLWEHVQAHVTNTDALAILTTTRDLPGPERAARMRAAAAAEGITTCALADAMASW